jgi:hypothetical protein
MNNSGTDLLVDAERRFTSKLCKAMLPVMLEAFWEMYQEAKKKSRTATMCIFQQLLKRVKGGIEGWGEVMVKQHVDAILKEQPMFPKLLAAVFIIHVKILSSIRTNNQSKKISISLPGNNLFVHSCYIKAANLIYVSNQQGESMFVDSITDAVRHERLSCLLCNAIRETVEDLVPIDEIMTTYLPTGDGVELGDGDGESDCEEEAQEEPSVEGEQAEETEYHPAETPGGHIEKPVEVSGTKSIPVVGCSPDQSQDLFPDAADSATDKNPDTE